MEKILVSACLLGMSCRYDGCSCESPEVKTLLKTYELVPFCPEVFGGMPTPRKKSGIRSCRTGDPSTGKEVWEKQAVVVSEEGEDVTPFFVKGAKECLKLAKMLNIKKALLKGRSPSCGKTSISCFGNIISGSGVCAFYLGKNGVEICEEN